MVIFTKNDLMKVVNSDIFRKCPICNSSSPIKGYSFDIFESNNHKDGRVKVKCSKRECKKCDIEYFDLIKGVNNFGKAAVNYYMKDLESRLSKNRKYKRRHFMLDKLLIKLFNDKIRILSLGAGSSSIESRFKSNKKYKNKFIQEMRLDVYPKKYLSEKLVFGNLLEKKSIEIENLKEFKPHIIVIDNVLEHVPNFEALSEILSYVNADYCYVSVPNRNSILNLLKKKEFDWPVQHVNNFNNNSLGLFMKGHNFRKFLFPMLPLNILKLRDWVFVASLIGLNIGGIYSLYKRK